MEKYNKSVVFVLDNFNKNNNGTVSEDVFNVIMPNFINDFDRIIAEKFKNVENKITNLEKLKNSNFTEDNPLGLIDLRFISENLNEVKNKTKVLNILNNYKMDISNNDKEQFLINYLKEPETKRELINYNFETNQQISNETPKSYDEVVNKLIADDNNRKDKQAFYNYIGQTDNLMIGAPPLPMSLYGPLTQLPIGGSNDLNVNELIIAYIEEYLLIKELKKEKPEYYKQLFELLKNDNKALMYIYGKLSIENYTTLNNFVKDLPTIDTEGKLSLSLNEFKEINKKLVEKDSNYMIEICNILLKKGKGMLVDSDWVPEVEKLKTTKVSDLGRANVLHNISKFVEYFQNNDDLVINEEKINENYDKIGKKIKSLSSQFGGSYNNIDITNTLQDIF